MVRVQKLLLPRDAMR